MEASALVYVILTIATVLFAIYIDNREYVPYYISGKMPIKYNRQQSRNLIAEIAIYGLLTGVSACRVAVGNDYWVYRENFKLVAQERHVSSEIGFNYIVKWMQDIFGYDNYKPIFALFSIVTVFFFVKALHDQGKWYAASLFLLLTGGYYFSSLNSIRYYLVLAISLYSMKYVLRKEYGKFILWILVAATFHKSVLVVIPIYLLANYLAGIKLKKWHFVAGGILIASLFLCQDLYRKVIFSFYPYYENTYFDVADLSLTNIAKCVGTLLLAFILYRSTIRDNQVNRFYFFLNIGGFVLYTCGSFIPEVSRIGYYMIISQVFFIPNMLMEMEKGIWKKLFVVGTGIAFSLYFILFLYRAYSVDIRLLPYLNWIFN